jgi:hypothetical protein
MFFQGKKPGDASSSHWATRGILKRQGVIGPAFFFWRLFPKASDHEVACKILQCLMVSFRATNLDAVRRELRLEDHPNPIWQPQIIAPLEAQSQLQPVSNG